MHSLRLAVATRCLRRPLRESLRAAAECGAQGVQFDLRDELRAGELTESGIRQLLHLAQELGLQIASTTFLTRRGLADREQLDARVAALRAAMEFAWKLQSRVLTVRLGKIPADAQSPERQLLRDVLNDLARHGNRVGVTLAVTPGQDSPEALGNLLASIQAGPAGIDFDPAALVIAGHAADAAFRVLHPHVLHVTARDAVRDVEGGLETALGRGEVDWIGFLPLLEEAAFRGWTTLIRTQGDDPPGDIARGVAYLRNVGLS